MTVSVPPTGPLSRFRRGLRSYAFISPRDIGLFFRSARTDSAIAKARLQGDDVAAFDAAYAGGDPWASNDSRYRYQRRKYDALTALLPADRRFARTLDLGTGLGLLARRMAERSDTVLGLDISQAAVAKARLRNADKANLRFEAGDLRDLPSAMDGRFDLVVIADTLCYLPRPIADSVLKATALRIAALLAPGGICLLANHYFFSADADSRLSRRIHNAFAWSTGFQVQAEHRRPFYLVSLLAKAA